MSTAANALAESADLVAQLVDLIGSERVILDEDERAFYSQDVYEKRDPVLAVIRPPSVEALQSAVKAINRAGNAIVTRGGGMSYTNAYLPQETNSVCVDMRDLNRIVEINEVDRYVTVECGCSWQALHSALAERGLRTPYWGPLSGIRATVGGALSQGSIFLGSSRYGSAADSLLCLDIVTASGELLSTGSAAAHNAKPFFRNFGPDLTGLFTSDAGMFGLKARATLKLISAPENIGFASFAFHEPEALLDAMGAIGARGLASECFAFDPFLQSARMKRESLAKDVKTLGDVIKAGDGLMGGLKDGLKLVAAGRKILEGAPFSMHVSAEGADQHEVDRRLSQIRELVGDTGNEIENSVPKVLRANPFVPVNSMLGPTGERWVPVHGIVPNSHARTIQSAVAAFFEGHQEKLDQHGIDVGYLMTAIAHSGFLIEPVFYWQDAQAPFHQRVVEADHLAKLNNYPEDLAARKVVDDLKHGLADLFHEHGAAHFQLGKFYHYRNGRNPEALLLMQAIKQALDPQNRLNPGALGFG